MASEQSYADRVGRANLLHGTVTGFPVAFISTDPLNDMGNFVTYTATCNTKNEFIDGKADDYDNQANARMAHVKGMKALVTRSLNYVLSVKSLKNSWSTVKRSAQRVTTIKPTKTKPENQGKKRNKGEQSFADIANNFEAYLSLLTTLGAPYNPTSAELLVANMSPLKTSLNTQSKDLGTLAGLVTLNRAERKNMFNGEDGLRDRMNSIKKAVKSQYGINSPEHNSVKGIKN